MPCFNPRAREGRDKCSPEFARHSGVSIHAPARGATSTLLMVGSGISSFNPRAREGRDANEDAVFAPIPGFNPRAREGRDVVRRPHSVIYGSFNPRAREGRDSGHPYFH